MERTDRKIRICAALLVTNILFIWGNSLLPGSVSGAISHWVRDVLAYIFQREPSGSDSGHGLVRKLAHLTEFACLGGLFAWLFTMIHKPVIISIVCGFSVAVIDETIQRIVPGRGPSVWDVLLDTAGVLLGMAILVFGYKFIKNKIIKFGGNKK